MKKPKVPEGQTIVDFSKLYTPTEKQIEAHTAEERYVLAGGALGGGKSRWLCAEAIQMSLDFPKNRGYLCRHENIVFKKTTLLTLSTIMPWKVTVNHNKQDQYIEFYNGSRIYYGGLRPTQAEKELDRIKSLEVGWFGIDEASETWERFFVFLTTRLRLDTVPNSSYRGLLTSNPEIGWVKERFIDNPMKNSTFIQMLPSDNPYLPEDYIEEMAAAFSGNPGWAARYLEGDWNAPMSLQKGFYLFPWPMIQGAINRELKEDEPVELGVDVARGGADTTQGYLRRGPVATHVIESDTADTMEIVALAQDAIEQYHPSVVRIDATGVGGGVADRLTEIYENDDTVEIIAFVAGSTANNSERFFNARSEVHWELRERAEAGDLDIPNDTVLSGQMAGIRVSIRSDKRIQVESKKEMKARHVKSPDKLDALMLAFGGSKADMVDVYFG